MKNKLILTLSFLIIAVFTLACVASAEVFNITYYDGNTVKDTVQTDENGTVTLRTERYSNTEAAVFNWFTYEGDIFSPGETITVTKDTDIRQFCGYKSTNKELNATGDLWAWRYIQLQEDLYLEKALAVPDGGRLYIDLNGYNIYTSANHVFDQRRSGVFILGKGSIIHTGSGNVFQASIHGYDDSKVGMVVGRDVTIETKGTVYNNTNGYSSGWITFPVPLYFYGNITCQKLVHINGKINEIMDLVVDPAMLTVLGDSLITFSGFDAEGSINMTVGKGTFVLTEAANKVEYWTAGYGDGYTFNIRGGSFINGADLILGFAEAGASKITTTVGEATYNSIIFAGCPHSYNAVGSATANCVTLETATYQCVVCNDSFVVRTGKFTEHKYEMIAHEPATQVTVGKKTYECTVCEKIYVQEYSFDPSDVIVSVIISTVEEGYIQVDVRTADVLELVAEERFGSKVYTLVGLKDFLEYKVENIVGIEIPVGISYFDFTQSNSTLEIVSVLDYANVTFSSFSKCTALTDINIGKATVTFNNGCANNVLKTIRSDVEGANVTFASSVFNEKKSVTNLILSSYSYYDFGSNSFRRTGLKELVFPDYCNPLFRDEAAFYDCAAEYIYVGKGITRLMGKPFDYCQKVQRIVLMEVTSFTHEYTFCVENAGEKPVEVFIHSSEISLPNNTFYQCHGIIIYTNAAITNASAFNQCNATTKSGIDYPSYTIVYGIPHKYTPGSAEPTCTADGSTGYTTDCPCGVVAEADYKTFVSTTTDGSYTMGKIETTVIPALGHLRGTLMDITYSSGYLAEGLARYDCMRCDNNGYYEEALDPMISCLGYSLCEFGDKLAIVQGYHLETEIFEMLSTIKDNVSCGIIAMPNVMGETKYPLTVENGELVATENMYFAPLKSSTLDYIEVKLVGITEVTKDVKIALCLYLFDGVYIRYANYGELTTGIVGNSYSSLITE